jgi:hypothetical protein
MGQYKRFRRVQMWPYLRYQLSICRKGLRKTTKTQIKIMNLLFNLLN